MSERPEDGVRSVDPRDTNAFLSLLASAGGEVDAAIEGPSMTPTIPAGSRVRLRCDGAEAIAPGTVVGFLAGGRVLTVHRAIARHGDYFVTQGDGNVFCDPPVPSGDVIGPVVGVVSGRGVLTAVADRAGRGASDVVRALSATLSRAALRTHVRLAQAVALASLLFVLPHAVVTRRSLRPPPILGMFSLRRPR